MSRWCLLFVLFILNGCNESTGNDAACLLHTDCRGGLCIEGQCVDDGPSGEQLDAAQSARSDGEIDEGLPVQDDCRTGGRGCSSGFVCRQNNVGDYECLEPVEADEIRDAFNAVIGNGRVYFYDSFGSTAIENLLARIKFLSKGEECDWIILDHLSIVVSGLGDGDERRLIDNAMTALRTLVQETGVGLILVSHLKRPDGNKGHEEGAQTSLSQLRGSHAIAQLSDMVLGLERNQQGEDANITTVRVLKNRFSGETGVACHVKYNPQSGRLHECNLDFEEDTNEF